MPQDEQMPWMPHFGEQNQYLYGQNEGAGDSNSYLGSDYGSRGSRTYSHNPSHNHRARRKSSRKMNRTMGSMVLQYSLREKKR